MSDKKINLIWQVGLQVQLSKRIKNREIKVTTRIVGWSTPHFIIIHIPYLNGFPLEMAPGAKCIIRFLNEGEVVGFESTVLKMQFDPIPLGFLSYPNKVENVSVRKEKRFKTLLPAVIRVKKEDGNLTEGKGFILDLNSVGCLISTQTAYKTDSTVLISFTLPTKDDVNDLVGNIKNIRASKDSKLLGIEFEEKSKEENKEKFDNFASLMNNLKIPEL